MNLFKNYIKKQLRWLFLFLIYSATASASQLSSLYTVELPIQDLGAFDQTVIMGQALENVVVQVSGSELSKKDPHVIKALKQPDLYVKQFSYHEIPSGGRLIKIIFLEDEINKLLASAKQKVLGNERPTTLVWMIIERDQKTHWVGGDQEFLLAEELKKPFEIRANPLVFPLFDLTDTTLVKEQDIIEGKLSSFEQASKRYATDNILLGRIHFTTGKWHGNWALIRGQDKFVWENAGTELAAIFNQLAEDLPKKNSMPTAVATDEVQSPVGAVSSATPGTVTIKISGIVGAEDYAKIVDYLRQLPSVAKLEVAEISPHKTTFRLKTNHEASSMLRALAESQILISAPAIDDIPQEVLTYKLKENF